MADQQTLTLSKRKRTRRNCAKEIADLESYCHISIDVLSECTTPLSDFSRGEVRAFEKVLAKIGATSGR